MVVASPPISLDKASLRRQAWITRRAMVESLDADSRAALNSALKWALNG